MGNSIQIYQKVASEYWDEQYNTVGWRTVNDSGGLEKTEKLAHREIELYLNPTRELTESLISDVENNPYPTMTKDMFNHPSFEGDTKRVLDYGCGGLGRYSAALSEHFDMVFGVDISVEAIKMAKQRLRERGIKNVLLQCCNGFSLNFPDNYFDFIFSNLVLQHIGDKNINFALAKEFGRVLKPGGMARLEYLDQSQKKSDDFSSPVEGNGISREELEPVFNSMGCKIECSTEESPWFWITVTK